MSHAYYDIPQGEVGLNNHFGSLVNVVNNSAAGNTLYDNIFAWASPFEMSQLWLEPGGLPTVVLERAKQKTKKEFSALVRRRINTINYASKRKDLNGLLHLVMLFFFSLYVLIKQCLRSDCANWAVCLVGLLVWPYCYTAKVKRFVSERLCQQSEGHSHSLACSHHSQ